ncbi:uncharacterized protein LOC135144750 isoform X2 [Zophobas morio]|uniref:uncharacterized protein LOC135144750 isoform X2 n=1 Tax=Zophobas morio TaxID=2755281 RepID=UPI0030827442
MVTENTLESEIKSWLDIILEKENLKNLSVQISGKTEKGDGYIGDVVFARAAGTAENESTKEYDLVLKCSKSSQALREDRRGISEVFKNIPKSYGTLALENREVVVLENLKSIGYELWPRQKPLTRKHIDLVMQAYGKYHATSIAFKQQEPEKYQEIVNTLRENLKSFAKSGPGLTTMKKCVEDAYEILKNDLDESTLLKWKSLGDNIQSVLEEIRNAEAMNVILHGDCWSNNFMYKYEDEDKSIPTEVVILDWQLARPAVLICDLSYFLFCCISENDIHNMEDVLNVYYKHFSEHLAEFGIDSNVLYPLNQLMDDWKKYCKYGIMFASMLLRITAIGKEDVVDVAEAVEMGKDFGESFVNEMKDNDKLIFKSRIQYIVEYVVKHGLI